MIIIATDIIGGPGKGILQFLKYAETKQFDFVLCSYKRSHRPLLKDGFFDEVKRQGIDIRLLKQRMLLDPTLVIQARRLIRAEGINIVQTHGYKSNILGCLLKLIYKIPWIAFSHGYISGTGRITIYNKMDLACYRFADKAVVVSDPLKMLLMKHHVQPSQIIKLDNAVTTDGLSPRQSLALMKRSLDLQEGDKVIGVIGRLSKEKGQIVFLKAFRKVTAQVPNVKALLIGDGPERSRLLAYCQSHGLEKKVRFTGHVTNIGDYYQLLDLVLIPSFSEGLPNVLLETMALGIPVIATCVGAIENVLQHLPHNLIPAGDEELMASKIQRFLNDPALCQKTTQHGQAIIADRFSPIERARKLFDVYHQVLVLQ